MKPSDKAKDIVRAVLYVLYGRGGFDAWWGDIDGATKKDINRACAVAVDKLLAPPVIAEAAVDASMNGTVSK